MREKNVTRCSIVISILCAVAAAISANVFADENEPNDKVYTAPLISIGDRYFTSVEIYGADEYLLLIDNGCRFSMIDPKIIDLATFKPERKRRINALNKSNEEVQFGRVRKLSVGELDLVSSKVIIAGGVCKKLSKAMHRRVYGILGYESIHKYVVRFDFRESRMLLTPAGYDSPDVQQRCVHADSLQLKPYEGFYGLGSEQWLAVEIRINSTSVPAMLDFGFTGELLTNVDHHRLGMEINGSCRKTPVHLLGLELTGRISSVDKLEIGRQKVGRTQVIYINDSELPELTLIGTRLLKLFNLTIDFEARKLLLSPRDDHCGLLVESRR